MIFDKDSGFNLKENEPLNECLLGSDHNVCANIDKMERGHHVYPYGPDCFSWNLQM